MTWLFYSRQGNGEQGKLLSEVFMIFGIRTKKMAARPGFEPRQTEPESVVLPLHHRAVRMYCKKWLRQLDSNQRPSG